MRRAILAALLSTVLFPVLHTSLAAAAPEPCADLSVASMSTTPDQPVAGLPFRVNITIHNGGTCNAPGFVVQWRNDRFAPSGPSESVASLGPGEDVTVPIDSNFTYPKAGNYESIVEVDTNNAVPETNEVNNLEILPITVAAATRNLTITDFKVHPAVGSGPVVQGRQATADITITNTGNSPASNFRLSWTPKPFTADLSRQINNLGPGEVATIHMNYTYPTAGTFKTTAKIDSTNAIAETNENDNTASQTLVVEPPLPDLEITNVAVSPTPIAGQPTTVTVTVTNSGNDPAGTFRVSWQPRPFTAPLSEEIGGLDVGQSQDVTFTTTFPGAGTFNGKITVDSTNAVKEVSETNNTQNTSITVGAATADLVVTDLHIECANNGREELQGTCDGQNPVQGEPLYAVITVKNQGTAPSGPFITQWNPSTIEIIPSGPSTVSQQIDNLNGGESTTIRLLFTYPKAGNFRTIAHVDAFNSVKETNEANNDKILNLTVDPAPIDLVVTDFTIAPSDPVRGVPATATITVRNNGPIDTGGFAVQWKPNVTGFGGPTSFINGLHPGESRTVTLTSTYFTKGTFTTSATVDVFNQVVEPFGEGNNTVTKTVNVVPQQTTLDVSITNVHVVNDGDDSLFQGTDAEWEQLFGVFDPNGGPCVYNNYGQHVSVPMVRCNQWRQDGVNSGDNLTPPDGNGTIRVTLQESTPLALAYLAVDRDNSVVGPDFPDPRGWAGTISFSPNYRTFGTQTFKGQKPCTDNNGYCFDVTFKVTVVSSNVPSSSMAPMSTAADKTQAQSAVNGVASINDNLLPLGAGQI